MLSKKLSGETTDSRMFVHYEIYTHIYLLLETLLHHPHTVLDPSLNLTLPWIKDQGWADWMSEASSDMMNLWQSSRKTEQMSWRCLQDLGRQNQTKSSWLNLTPSQTTSIQPQQQPHRPRDIKHHTLQPQKRPDDQTMTYELLKVTGPQGRREAQANPQAWSSRLIFWDDLEISTMSV